MPLPRDHHADGADQVVRLDMVAEEERQRLVDPGVRRGLRQELRGHVADAVRMAEVVAHEMLDRQQAVGRFEAAVLGQAKLLRTGEHVAGLAGVEVQLIAKPEQERVGRLDGVVIFLAQRAAIAEFGEVGHAVAGEADPAQQLQIAKRALRSLDVGLQEEDRLAVAPPLVIARPLDARQQPAAAPADPLPEGVHEVLEDQRISGQQAGIDQRGADHGVARGQRAGLPHRADAMPQDQPHVEHVADQPLGQGEQARGGGRPVENHQVDVAVGRHVAAAVTAVGHDRDVVHESLGTAPRQDPARHPRPVPGSPRREDCCSARKARSPGSRPHAGP